MFLLLAMLAYMCDASNHEHNSGDTGPVSDSDDSLHLQRLLDAEAQTEPEYPRLPAGWERRWSNNKRRGEMYYCNDQTGQSHWADESPFFIVNYSRDQAIAALKKLFPHSVIEDDVVDLALDATDGDVVRSYEYIMYRYLWNMPAEETNAATNSASDHQESVDQPIAALKELFPDNIIEDDVIEFVLRDNDEDIDRSYETLRLMVEAEANAATNSASRESVSEVPPVDQQTSRTDNQSTKNSYSWIWVMLPAVLVTLLLLVRCLPM